MFKFKMIYWNYFKNNKNWEKIVKSENLDYEKLYQLIDFEKFTIYLPFF